MRREQKWWYQDGVRHFEDVAVDVVGDYVIPCGYCGIPCGGYHRLWYAVGEVRRALDLDKFVFEALLHERLWERTEYASFPRFVREWNECIGWCGIGARNHEVELDDVQATARLLGSVAESEHERRMTKHMAEFVEECRLTGGTLFASDE